MTVGVNISHDSSVCIKKQESIKFFEESRFNKKKYWSPTPNNFDYISFKNIKDFNDVFVKNIKLKILYLMNLCITSIMRALLFIHHHLMML